MVAPATEARTVLAGPLRARSGWAASNGGFGAASTQRAELGAARRHAATSDRTVRSDATALTHAAAGASGSASARASQQPTLTSSNPDQPE